MLIKFNILWVDDDSKYVKSTEKVLRTHLDSLGFYLEVEYIENPKDESVVTKCLSCTSKYDLILVDWHFRSSKSSTDEKLGVEVIERIREDIPFADIMFYSGSSGLEDELKSTALQGVYICNRIDLKDEIKDLIAYLLHKTLHPKIMRGIIVSELSNIDDLCYRIIEAKYNHTDCNKVDFANKIKTSLQKQINKQHEHKVKIIEKNEDDFIKEIESTVVLDSYKRSLQIQKFAREDDLGERILDPILELPGTVTKRNKIAHWKRSEESDDHILLKEAGKEDYLFDQNEAILMRKNINSIAVALEGYLDLLKVKGSE